MPFFGKAMKKAVGMYKTAKKAAKTVKKGMSKPTKKKK